MNGSQLILVSEFDIIFIKFCHYLNNVELDLISKLLNTFGKIFIDSNISIIKSKSIGNK